MTTSCPANERLKQMLDGGLSDDDQSVIQSHLEICESCQRTLESLAAGKESWSSAARHLAGADAAREAALDDLINQAKHSSKIEVTSDESDSSGPVVLDFLQPADQPGILGRLGHYDVIEKIDSGGMGFVLKAFDSSLRRIVAIKVMSPHLAANASARRRFVREARAAAAVAHEHVVAIHAVADHEPPYLVMQFIEGKTLQDRLDHSGPPSVREILRIGMQTAAGLEAAHEQGLVHRDIKPANILLENGIERVKLTDFGLARAVDDASVTQSGVIAGTPLYMSPEQARGETVDHRSDLFSLGSVLYAMCVGHAPFRATTTMGVLKRLCEESARPISELNPEIPNWLCDIITKLHAKKPADRFQSAREVAELLSKYLAHLQQPTVVSMPARIESASRPVPTVRPMFVAVFWSGWAILAVMGVIAALARFGFLPQSAVIPVSPPLMTLVSIGLVSLVMMVIVQAISNRSWRATSLGPRPVLAAIVAASVLFVAIFFGLDLKMRTVRNFVTQPTSDTAQLSFALAGPQVAVTLNGKRVTVNDGGRVTMQLQPGEYEVVTLQNGQPDLRSGEVLHKGQQKFVENRTANGIQVTGPLNTITKELHELVAQSEQDVINIRELYSAGNVTMFEVNRTEQALLAVKVRLATAEGRTEDLPRLHDELVKLYESTVAIAEQHFKNGVMPQSELSKSRKELTEARIQREAVRQQSARGRRAPP